VRFELEQRYASPPDDVAAAFADPALYPLLAELPKMGAPEVVGHRVEGSIVVLEVRYRFVGHLSAAARAVLDPERLTWVERSTHDVERRHVDYELLPDHYQDRFRSSGSYHFDADGPGSVRRARGEVRVKAPLVAGAVERAIVSGLREHLPGEAEVVDRFIAGRG
jgi:hypothetical protein